MRIIIGAWIMLAVSAGICGPSFAQTPGTAGPNCLFPLACPGPVPPKPEPLYGPPEDQAAAQPADAAPRLKHKARKRVSKKAH